MLVRKAICMQHITSTESYTDYEGDDAPTDAMVEYANLKIDEYTAQLMEEGLI